jgi:hypothetical protein
MSNFYRVWYDIQNAPDEPVSYISSTSSSESESEDMSINTNQNNPYLTPKYSYINPNSVLFSKNWNDNDDNVENEHNKPRKRCKIVFTPPFSEKNKPKNLFNTSIISKNKENKEEDDNLSTNSGFSCFSFRPDLLDRRIFHEQRSSIHPIPQTSTDQEDLVYSDISDDEH